MPSKQDYLQLENRIQQGSAVAVATFAMTAVTSFRMGHEQGLYLGPGSVAKFSLITAGIAGLIWSFMPRAKDSPSDTIEEAKGQLYPALKIAINRMIANEESFKEKVRESRENREYNHNGSGGYSRFARRYESRFNTGFDDDYDMDSPSEDDFVTDDEFADILEQELLEDPFYAGPGSIFDRL